MLSSPSSPSATVSISLADAFSNPVPDGTPIVFQTNRGAIGTSDKGGCNTVNGYCSVMLRAQKPFVPTPGLPQSPCNAIAPDSTRPGVATAPGPRGTDETHAYLKADHSHENTDECPDPTPAP